jgi:preprotein translocase subunit SecG
MIAALYVIFVLNCFFLILVVLLQAGKGDAMTLFSGGGDSILGARGAATFLSKLTVASATMFMVLSIVLAYHSSNPDSRVGRGIVDPNEPLPGAGALDDDSDEDDNFIDDDETVVVDDDDDDDNDETAAANDDDETANDDDETAAANDDDETAVEDDESVPEPDGTGSGLEDAAVEAPAGTDSGTGDEATPATE